MNKVIYCISGLGADEKIFNNLELNGHYLKHIPWLKPNKKETIVEYARRMREKINDSPAILLGVSFGGMVGIEIAKQMQIEKLIIVSSIKNVKELPGWMRLAGQLQLNKFLPTRSYKFTRKIDNDRLGVSNEEEAMMVQAYRNASDPNYLTWAINEVLNWRNDWHPTNLIHIHGDKDKIFPIKKVNVNHVIKGGTHLMIYNRAKEISRIIEQSL